MIPKQVNLDVIRNYLIDFEFVFGELRMETEFTWSGIMKTVQVEHVISFSSDFQVVRCNHNDVSRWNALCEILLFVI